MTATWPGRVALPARSPATASDTATTESVLVDVLDTPEAADADEIGLVQATSPLLRAGGPRRGATRCCTPASTACCRWCGSGGSGGRRAPDGAHADYDPAARPRRQQLAGHLVENGALYLTSRAALARTGVRISGRIGLWEMPEESYTEVDEPADLVIVDALLRRRERPVVPVTGAERIRLVLTDVDGVLTDNGMTYSSDGSESKTYSARDGKGFELLRRAGIRTGILTSEDGPQIRARAKKLQVDALYAGTADKLADAKELCARWSLAARRGGVHRRRRARRRAAVAPSGWPPARPTPCPPRAPPPSTTAARRVGTGRSGSWPTRSWRAGDPTSAPPHHFAPFRCLRTRRGVRSTERVRSRAAAGLALVSAGRVRGRPAAPTGGAARPARRVRARHRRAGQRDEDDLDTRPVHRERHPLRLRRRAERVGARGPGVPHRVALRPHAGRRGRGARAARPAVRPGLTRGREQGRRRLRLPLRRRPRLRRAGARRPGGAGGELGHPGDGGRAPPGHGDRRPAGDRLPSG